MSSFEKLSVYFYGIDSGNIRTLSAALKELGGVSASILGKQVTHLITCDEKLKEEGYQIAQAEKLGIPIVTLSWLELSIESKKILPLDLYLLSDPENSMLRRSGSSSLRSSSSLRASSPLSKSLSTSLSSSLQKPQALIPTAKCCIPPSGAQNNLRIVVLGNNFNVSGEGVVVNINSTELPKSSVQVHSRTSLVVTVPDSHPRFPLGRSMISVSNDDGHNFGAGADFVFDSPPSASSALSGGLSSSREEFHQDKREIRIFLSSPFRDMQQERDWFVKWVAPKLKKLCAERSVSLTFVDLRWGVTGDQSSQAISLLMCLRELARSNLFVGLYGARYGWSYDSQTLLASDNELILRTFEMASKEFPWVNKYIEKSITEVEMRAILDGVKRIPAIFFLRDNAKFLETEKIGNRHIYQSEGREQAAKLSALVNDIQNSSHACTTYTRPFEMAELAYSQIEKIISDKFPLATVPNQYIGEDASHHSFIRTLSRIYLPFTKNYFLLDKYIASPSTDPFIITGDAGVGKSSLLANWVVRFKKHHPEDIVFSHFVGCSTASTMHTNLILRVMQEIKGSLGKSDHGLVLPTGAQIVQDFSLWLAKSVEKLDSRRLVIVIDGAERLEDYDNALELLWLPREFPQKVKIILSMSSNTRPLNAMKKRKHDKLELLPLAEWDRVEFIRTYLDWHSKKLDETQEFLIASAEQVQNPRFGKILLDDIAVFGEYEKLNERIKNNLTARTTQDLYIIVINRLHEDYDKDNTGVVEAFLTLMWASRRGLTEEEITILMGGMGYQRNEWSPIFLVMEDMLFRSGDSGLLNFTDTEFKEAIRKQFLTEKKKVIFAHETIANYFANLKVNLRKAEEYPWQISQIDEPKRLAEALADLDIFLELWFHQELKFYLLRWWKELEKEGFSIIDVYTGVLDFYEKDKYYQEGKDAIKVHPFLSVGNFLEESRKLESAELVYNRAFKLARTPKDRIDVMNNLARLYETQARFDLAESILRETLIESDKLYGVDSIQSSNPMTRLGSVLIHTTKLNEANEMLKNSLKIRQKVLGKSHSRCGQTLKHLLVVAQHLGDYTTAEQYALDALKNTEEACGPFDFHVSSILLRMGELYNVLHRHQDAEQCFDRALSIRVTKYGDDHPFTGDVLREIAVAHENQQQWPEAEEKYLRSLKIKLASIGEMHPDIAQIKNRLAAVYINQKRYDEAEPFLVDALRIREERLGVNHSRVGQTLKHMLTLYELKGDYQKAANCGYRALDNTKHSFGEDHFHVSSILLRLGVLESSLNQIEKAEASFEVAKAIRVKKFGENHDYVADVLHDQGAMRLKLNELDVAKPLLEEAFRIRTKAKGPNHALTLQTASLLKRFEVQ